jgi:signal transduction histidine kinase
MTPTPPAKVLVIDDELGPRESLRMLLKNKFQIFLAEGVAAGLRLVQAEHPDVVLLDIRMPGTNGIDGLSEIRKLDPDVAVLILTGFGALETAQEAIRRGANDYLRKPFDAHEMLATVRQHAQRARLLRRHRETSAELRKINQLMLDELARKNHLAQVGQKSAEFIHDLRNPLTAVLGYIELLGDELRQSKEKLGPQWDETADFLQNIEKNLEHCREMSNLWLQYSRRDEQPLQTLRVCDVLREIVEAVRPLCLARAVTLELEHDPNVSGQIEAEHIQLVRAFGNLVNNALDAVPDGTGVIKISCDCRGQSVEIRISDNGPGISPEHLPRIFEPYFTTKGQTGTGLGLFIAQQVIAARGGTVTAENRPGAGATFTVRLPLLPAT